MKTITIEIPDNVDLDEKETKMHLAAQLYECGILSLGQAAEMVNIPKRNFMESLYKYGVSIFNYDDSELKNDVKNAENYLV